MPNNLQINFPAIFTGFIFFIFSNMSYGWEHPPGFWQIIELNNFIKESDLEHTQLEFQARFHDDDSKFRTGKVSLSHGYKFNKVFGYLGADWLTQAPKNSSKLKHEFRIWPQITGPHYFFPIDQVIVTPRLRLEIRALEGESQQNLRLRTKVNFEFTKPLHHQLPWAFGVIFDELFWNLKTADWGNSQVIDQNRFFIGANLKHCPNLTIQAGYLNQLEIRDPEYRMNHILYVKLKPKVKPIFN